MSKLRDMTAGPRKSIRYTVDADSGCIGPARQCPSDNQDERPPGSEPQLLIIHGISLPPGEFGGSCIEELFCNSLDWNAHPYFGEIRGMRVSAHLLLRRDGGLTQFVPFDRRAWHAGESSFRGRSGCNDYSIGIELEGSDDTEYSVRQYRHLAAVIAALCAAYPQLSSRAIAGHCDVSPGRKTDPGPAFDWLHLYDGLAESSEKT